MVAQADKNALKIIWGDYGDGEKSKSCLILLVGNAGFVKWSTGSRNDRWGGQRGVPSI